MTDQNTPQQQPEPEESPDASTETESTGTPVPDTETPDTEETKSKKKGKKKKDKDPEKAKDAGRSIETMFRTSLRNHISLSEIADKKANIMLTINGGINAFALGSLFPRFAETPLLVMPTMVLVTVTVTALIYAVISTIPKVTQGTFTKEDIRNKRANLLFFGNFYKMSLEDFEWGINEMIKDKEYLYGSMIRDFYNLGKVLSVKYKYLRISYAIFLAGMIVSALAFAAAFIFKIGF